MQLCPVKQNPPQQIPQSADRKFSCRSKRAVKLTPAMARTPLTSEERRVIFAASLGTVFEWYDFYLYGSPAGIISKQFFSGVNETTAFIFALLAFAAGGTAIVTESRELETALAVPFGIGAGLTMDEAALLLELDDVYWLPRGRLSIRVSAATIAVLGATILGMRLLQRGERRTELSGLIPAEPG